MAERELNETLTTRRVNGQLNKKGYDYHNIMIIQLSIYNILP